MHGLQLVVAALRAGVLGRAVLVRRPVFDRSSAPTTGGGQRSRIAVTPWPPAAQIEITPRPLPFSASSLARRGDDPAAGGGERVARRQRGAVDVELGPVDRAERRVEAEPLLAEDRVLPRLQGGQHLRGERLVDLVEVEVLQRSGPRARASAASRRPGPSAAPRRRARSRPRRSRRRSGRPAAPSRAPRPTPPSRAAPPRRRRSAAWSCRRSSWRPRPCRRPA